MLMTVQLVSGAFVRDDDLIKLFCAAHYGDTDCGLRTTDGERAVVQIERANGNIRQMTVGEEVVDRGVLVMGLNARLSSELDVIRTEIANDPLRQTLKLVVLEGVAAAFGVTIKTGIE